MQEGVDKNCIDILHSDAYVCVCVHVCMCVSVAGVVDGDGGMGMEGFTICWYVLGSSDNGFAENNFLRYRRRGGGNCKHKYFAGINFREFGPNP